MVWHIECYNQHNNASEYGSLARYATKCDRPGCTRLVQPGQRYWARKYNKRTASPYNPESSWDSPFGESTNATSTQSAQTVNGVSRSELDEALRGIILSMDEKLDRTREAIVN